MRARAYCLVATFFLLQQPLGCSAADDTSAPPAEQGQEDPTPFPAGAATSPAAGTVSEQPVTAATTGTAGTTDTDGGNQVGTGDGTSGGIPGAAGLGATGTTTNLGTGDGFGGGVAGAAGLGATGTGVPTVPSVDAGAGSVLMVF